MIGGLAGFILLNAFSLIQTLDVLRTEAALGDTVTLTCEVHGHENGLFYWYKMNPSYKIQTVAKGNFGKVNLEEQNKNSRFHVSKETDVYYLTVRNVSKEDEATYLCQSGAAYAMTFINVTYLVVNPNREINPDMKPDQLQDSVTLQCSVISEDKDNLDHCSGRRRFYRLCSNTQNSVDTETFYCTETTCGENLFGLGRIKLDPVFIALGALLSLSVTVIAVLIFYGDLKAGDTEIYN